MARRAPQKGMKIRQGETGLLRSSPYGESLAMTRGGGSEGPAAVRQNALCLSYVPLVALIAFAALGPLLALGGWPATAGEIEPVSAGRPFRIGYVHPEAKEPLSPAWFRALRRFLETEPAVEELRAALAAEPEAYGGFRLIAAEGFYDLIDRMRAPEPELDVVFCPAVAYCRVIQPAAGPGARRRPGAGDYRVIFQLQGPRDSGRTPFVLRHGVIFVNAHHPLFRDPAKRNQEPVPAGVIAEHFRSEPVALVSRYSACGYYYPCRALGTPPVLPTRPVFCGSSEEVVKMVLSDMVGMGACEEAVLDDVFARSGIALPAERVYDKILSTGASPTDPIVFRSGLSPEQNPKVAKLLKGALRLFFRVHRPEGYSLVESKDEDFYPLQEVLEEFDEQGPAK